MRRRKRKLNVKAFAVFVMILALSVCAGYAGVKYMLAALFPDVPRVEQGEEDLLAKRMHLVLLGIDAQEGETAARADSILFVSADPKEQRVALLSIPRDTRVNLPGHGWEKINAATVYGGPELAVKVVSELLGVPVDYYVVTSFDGFRDVVDILGGVEIEVERRMYYRDPVATPPLVIDLQPGLQRLDGEKALQYVRFRCDELGDITRTQRQQKFLMALAKEMLKPRNITKLPKLVPKINDCVETNLELREMIRWAGLARKLDGVEMVSATLPGTFVDLNGLSYWYVDPVRAKEVAVKLMHGEEIGDPLDERLAPAWGVAYQPAPPSAEAAAQDAVEEAAPADGASQEPAGVQDEEDAGHVPSPDWEEPSGDPAEPPATPQTGDPVDVADWPAWTGYPEGIVPQNGG
jgi:LCP family protein required for cell wall assembly